MHEIVKIDLIQFLLVYIILLVVGLIMKYCRVNQTKLLFIASTRMTVQLVIAGFILTYILQKNNP
ncbi:MAG: ABC transporter permease, partial [Firmicutes bacterium]|nr:ABC transporter permease [Candidatus Gallilactobacillus intestinavium]